MKLIKRIVATGIEYRNSLKYYFVRRKIKVMSLEETIDKIILEKCSISRFGDGEFYCMDGNDIKFQEKDSEMAMRLQNVLTSNEKGHLVCIGGGYNPLNYSEFTSRHVKWMKNNFRNTIEMRLKYMNTDKVYYNALISRFWIPFKDKRRAKKVAEMLKRIWENRDVVIIEGCKTRMGVGNDLLENVSRCRRILCPATNAYKKYNEIMGCAKMFSEDVLFLIALGPTATILSYDLHKLGYQALDIGHLDLEYEWMKRGTEEQINLSNKFVNELSDGEIVEDSIDAEYKSQIVYMIEESIYEN